MAHYVLDGEFPTANEYINAERSQRGLAARIKKRYTEYASRELAPYPPLPTGRHDFEFVWYRENDKTDPSNVLFGSKFVFDGMVKAGILEDDDSSHVGYIGHRVEVDKKRPRVEIFTKENKIS